MVRATPTGVSAVIDAYGRVLPGKELGQGAYGVIDARLPAALPPTVFGRCGAVSFIAMLLFSFAFAISLWWPRDLAPQWQRWVGSYG